MMRPPPTTVRAAESAAADLGGMVGVVVEDADSALHAVQLEPAHGAFEAFDGADGRLELVPERQQHRDGAGRVDRRCARRARPAARRRTTPRG